MKISKKVLVVAILLTVGALATVAVADHSWGGYHWARTSNPFTLKLGDNLTSTWDSYLVTSSADWSTSTVLDTTVVAGLTNATKGKKTPKNCVPTAGRVEVCNSRYGANGWLGIASVWANGLHITQGTVKLNDTYFNTSTYNKPAWKNLVMCQEVAHTFGLDHQDEIFDNTNLGTCMDYTNDPDGTIKGQLDNQFANAHDFEELGIIYAHLDSSTTLSQSVSSKPGLGLGQDEDFTDASSWGTAIRFSSDSKPSVFARDLGNNQKVFTFVIWAN